MAKKTQGYGFNVSGGSGWAYPESGRAPLGNPETGDGVRQEWGYDAETRVKSARSRPQGQPAQYPPSQASKRPASAPRQSRSGTAQRPSASPQRQQPQTADTRSNWAYPAYSPHINRPSGAGNASAQISQRSSPVYDRARDPYAVNRSADTPRRGQPQQSRSYSVPLSDVPMTDEQRKKYEAAYYAKYGRSPYSSQSAPREDRRQAFLREESLRAEQQRREREAQYRREQEEKARRDRAARQRAEEMRREEQYRLRQEEERRREAEMRRREAERRRREAQAELERKKHRRLLFKKFKFHTVVVIIAIAVTLIALAAVMWAVFWGKGSESSKSITYYYGDKKVTGVSDELANPSGDIRINFTELADMFGFYKVSDGASFKFVVTEGDESDPSEGTGKDQYISFDVGSTTAVVNGTTVNLSSDSVYTADSLWVSDDIMDCVAGGISYTVSGRSVSFKKVNEKDEEGNNLRDDSGSYVYVPVTLKYSLSNDLTDVDLDDIYGPAENAVNGTPSAVTFKADLSEYEKYMNPEDATPYLVLVNKTNTVDESFVPENLVDIADTRKDGRKTQQMNSVAEKALEAMFIELRENGFTDVSVTSGYRDYAYQKQIFNSYINQEMAKGLTEEAAREEVLTYSAAPGTSEHQTGLCCDMHNLGAADVAFANEDAYKWLKENCWKFGFILRFPEGKDDITGYQFEPWHYRFVGRYTAEKIYNSGMCLEEYLDTVNLN